MKYLCLIYNEEKNLDAMLPDALDAVAGECVDFDEALKKNGQLIGANAFNP